MNHCTTPYCGGDCEDCLEEKRREEELEFLTESYEDSLARAESQRLQRLEQINRDFPQYSEESRRAGAFIGLDFPYVPGDPGL